MPGCEPSQPDCGEVEPSCSCNSAGSAPIGCRSRSVTGNTRASDYRCGRAPIECQRLSYLHRSKARRGASGSGSLGEPALGLTDWRAVAPSPGEFGVVTKPGTREASDESLSFAFTGRHEPQRPHHRREQSFEANLDCADRQEPRAPCRQSRMPPPEQPEARAIREVVAGHVAASSSTSSRRTRQPAGARGSGPFTASRSP
jgi:hypothetical protein